MIGQRAQQTKQQRQSKNRQQGQVNQDLQDEMGFQTLSESRKKRGWNRKNSQTKSILTEGSLSDSPHNFSPFQYT
jgi:hypothetical protein